MSHKSKLLGIICGVISSLLCLAAGIWILVHCDFDAESVLEEGIGLYFIGKAFFVGPMLLLSALKKEG